MKNNFYMGIDQYGNTFHNLKHPRKDLMEQIGTRHAEKMYTDGDDGKTYHTGYVVGGHWVRLYAVEPVRR